MTPTIEQDHAAMVLRLCKKGDDILKDMSPQRMHLLHMASKLCSEAGELMDAVGKLCFYNKSLDMENVKEELGDAEFYLQGIRQGLSLSRNECLQHNIDKLGKRYNTGYSDINAQARADKQ